jgi:hypothetical protein
MSKKVQAVRRATRRSLTERSVVHPKKPWQEAGKFLNDGQILELKDVTDRLEDLHKPREIWDLKIEWIGGLGRLFHTGTSLLEIEAEVWFADLPERGVVVILGVFPRQPGKPSEVRLERMKIRREHYRRIVKK